MDGNLQIALSAIAILFDALITYTYLNVIFKNRAEWATPWKYGAVFIAANAASITLQVTVCTNWVYCAVVGIATFFVLAFLYESSVMAKIFASASFQVFAMIAELISYSIFNLVSSRMDDEYANIIISPYSLVLAKLILLIIIIIVSLLMKNDTVKANFKNYLCLVVVPLISAGVIIAITFSYGYKNINSGIFNLISAFGILLINFIVYYLLNNIIKANEIMAKQTIMENQIKFQEQKYEQTSMSFKNISSVIHDTNKHLTYLRECAVQNNNIEAIEYIDKAQNNLCSSYKRINTGYLPIDSLVSNALNTAENNNIEFNTDIKIDKSRISVERYDLCVALGNILDNAVEACLKIDDLQSRRIMLKIFTTENALVINSVNSAAMSSSEFKTDKKDKLRHGYGIQNINRIADKYGGSFVINKSGEEVETTLILPFE